MNFETAVTRALDAERGYVNNPKDPGGETNMGITEETLQIAIADGIVASNKTIKTLVVSDAKNIYRSLFWGVFDEFSFSFALRYQMFDFAINSGYASAVRMLQYVAGTTRDGIIGPITLTAISAIPDQKLVLELIAVRLEFMTYLRNWPNASRGWSRRMARNLKYAVMDLV
jgi:lysozyme family protein